MMETFQEYIVPMIYLNRVHIESVKFTLDTQNASEIVVKSLMHVNKLKHLALFGFNYTKNALGYLTDFLRKNTSTLRTVVIHYSVFEDSSIEHG